MSGHSDTQTVRVVMAEPGALGLFGLAMVTLVASSQKLGWTTGLSLVIPWAIFLEAIAQLFAAVADAKRNNIFGTTAFGAYGLFWMGVALSWLIKMGAFGTELAAAADPRQLGVAFIGYLIFSLYMTVASLETNKVLFIIFVLIDVLFVGLAGATLGVAPEQCHAVAAWTELIIALVSFYGSAGVVLHHHIGREILPMGKPFGILKR
jgi:succinate-acetate transporter protein